MVYVKFFIPSVLRVFICFAVLRALTGFGESLYAQTLEAAFLVDFGADDTTNGLATPSPDDSGNAWNNLTTLDQALALTSTSGSANGPSLLLAGDWRPQGGTIRGGLTDPTPGELGKLAVATATQDFFLSSRGGTLTMSGLNPERGYVLEILASVANPQTRTAQYEVAGANRQTGFLQSSGVGLGGGDYNGNRANTFRSAPVFPDAGGRIVVTASRAAGSFVYFNAMLLEEYSGVGFTSVQRISVRGDDVTEPGAVGFLRAELTPADADIQGVSWSVSDRSVALIDQDGTLYPRAEGTLTAFAKTQQPGSDVRGQADITIANQRLTSYLIDFGPDDGTNGNATTSPDAQGRTWTNLTDATGGTATALVSESGDAGTATIEATGLATNGLLHGGLLLPDTSLLAQLGVPTATQDYFFADGSGTITLRGLDPTSGYRFFALGSRDAAERRLTRYSFDGARTSSGVLQTSGEAIGSEGASGNDSETFASELVRPNAAGTITLTLETEAGSFAYLNALQVVAYDSVAVCPNVNPRKLTFMGSSVARGQGAPSDRGYAFQIGQLLERRAATLGTPDYAYANVSVGGNRTTNVIDRYERDLIPECGGYVAFGLSLANEGIRSGGQAVYDQFRSNLRGLAERALTDGLQPIIVSNYARGDYDAGDYTFIRQINTTIAQWPYPSVNVLGALDDGTGRWPQGFAADNGHPNAAGHAEMAASFVPSLLDALEAGKPAPVRQPSEGVSIDESIVYLGVPDDLGLRSFTSAFEVKVESPSALAGSVSIAQVFTGFASDTVPPEGSLFLDAGGALSYRHADGQTIRSSIGLGDSTYHDVALTYYHAGSRILLYVDGALQGELDAFYGVDQASAKFYFTAAPVRLRQWHLYRAGMNADEIALVAADSMLASSLEVYSPLDGESLDGPFQNLAQSTSEPSSFGVVLSNREPTPSLRLTLHPNPSRGDLTVSLPGGEQLTHLSLYSVLGGQVWHRDFTAQASSVNLALPNLPSGVYVLRAAASSGRTGVSQLVVR